MRYVGYAMMASPLVGFTALMIAVHGLAFALGIWVLVAAILVLVIAGAHIAGI